MLDALEQVLLQAESAADLIQLPVPDDPEVIGSTLSLIRQGEWATVPREAMEVSSCSVKRFVGAPMPVFDVICAFTVSAEHKDGTLDLCGVDVFQNPELFHPCDDPELLVGQEWCFGHAVLLIYEQLNVIRSNFNKTRADRNILLDVVFVNNFHRARGERCDERTVIVEDRDFSCGCFTGERSRFSIEERAFK